MPRRHTVEPGDCLASIAAAYGLASWRTILDDPANQALRERLQENPNIVPVGEEVTIPDRRLYSAPARARTRIVLPKPDLVELKLIVELDSDHPAAGKRWKLTVDGKTHEGTLGDDGLLSCEIPASADQGDLEVWIEGDDKPATALTLELGRLEPADTVTGAQARLANLGYYDGPLHGDLDDITVAALRAFQQDRDLTVNGVLDATTADALADAHEGAS